MNGPHAGNPFDPNRPRREPLRLKVRREIERTALPPGVEVVRAIGGTVVYRTRIGCKVTENGA